MLVYYITCLLTVYKLLYFIEIELSNYIVSAYNNKSIMKLEYVTIGAYGYEAAMTLVEAGQERVLDVLHL